MSSNETLSASLEDYLKTIAAIVDQKQAARAKDISSRLNVNMSSVTSALHALAERDLINYAPYEMVTLTDKGRQAAREVVRRHEGVRDFLIKVLAVNDGEADVAACAMEHSVSRTIVERLIQFVQYIEMCPRVVPNWTREYGFHCRHPNGTDDCEHCLTISLDQIKKKKEQDDERRVVGLNELGRGKKGRVVKVGGEGEIRRRIVEMGVTPGTLVEVERIAPLGDPIGVKVKGYHLSLRMVEARTITVEVV